MTSERRNSSLEELIRYYLENDIPIPLGFNGFHIVEIALQGTAAAAAANYNHAAIFPYTSGELIQGWYSYSGEGGAAAAFVVNKIASGTASDSGTSMTQSCDTATAGQINVPRAITLLTGSAIQISQGERIGLEDSGTITGLDDLIVTLKFKITQY